MLTSRRSSKFRLGGFAPAGPPIAVARGGPCVPLRSGARACGAPRPLCGKLASFRWPMGRTREYALEPSAQALVPRGGEPLRRHGLAARVQPYTGGAGSRDGARALRAQQASLLHEDPSLLRQFPLPMRELPLALIEERRPLRRLDGGVGKRLLRHGSRDDWNRLQAPCG